MPADTRWFSLDDIEKAAQNTLTKEHADFFAGAAGDESTLRSNRDAFERIRLRPRVLRTSRAEARASPCSVVTSTPR